MCNATAYGVSPRVRLDIVVNNLVGFSAFRSRDPRGERQDAVAATRLVHVEDISHVVLAVLRAPRQLVDNEAFNVRAN
jgi:hypothetical protein